MKEGIYYCSLDDFLEKNREKKLKKSNRGSGEKNGNTKN